MKRYVVSLLVLAFGIAMGPMTRVGLSQQPQERPLPAPSVPTHEPDAHGHLSKKEKKERKKERDHERKAEKERLKREAKERQKEDKERQKQIAKERKHDHDADKKEEAKERYDESKRDRQAEEKQVARDRHDEHKRDEKREEKERKEDRREVARGSDHPSMVGRTASLAGRTAIAPFRLALHATPPLLRAQRDVSKAIYSQFPASNVAVLLSDAGQVVLRGAAPSSPSLRSSLLQLAMGAAGGYPVIDQLATDFIGDAASAAASAAVGGVSDLIHGRPDENGDTGSAQPAYADNSQPSTYGPPSGAPESPAPAAIDDGSTACANVANSNRVVLTGQATSQASAELIRQFALQLGGASATLDDQLATRSNGAATNASRPGDRSIGAPESAVPSTAETQTPLTPGSNVCVNLNHEGEVLLTGTVASPAELSAVERAAQPLVGGAQLLDRLTIGAVGASPNAGESSGITKTANVATEESELEQALHAVPRLANVDVQLTAENIRLSGSVDTSGDEQTARDIARQRVPGRSIVDNITVAGRAPAPNQ